MCVTRHYDMRKISISDKEELYDVIAALSANIRQLTYEIVDLQGIQLELGKLLESIICSSRRLRDEFLD